MNLEFLKEFIYLADTLSFRKTADHFYVSRSVISRHMAALEEALGTRLFERDGGGVRLTETGRVFYREAKTVLRDWELAFERVQSAKADGRALVRMGYLRNGARPFLVSFVNYMAQAHPGVNLSLLCMEYDELRRALQERAVDVAVAINVDPSLSQHYRSTPIYKDRFYALCSHSHPLAAKGSEGVRLSDLADQKLLVPDSYVQAGLGGSIRDFVDDEALRISRSIYRDVDTLYLKVQTEDYVALVSRMNSGLFGDLLATLPICGLDTSFAVSAFYHHDFEGSAFEACREGFEWSCRFLEESGPRYAPNFFGLGA